MAEILFQGHGSLRLTTAGGTVIYIDPYVGDGYDALADLVLVSHEHHDHNRVELVTLKEGGKILRAGDFLQDGVYREVVEKDVKIKGTEAYNKNHPKSSCVGFVLSAGGKKLYLACDTSETEEMKTLADEHLDYAFLPIDGIYNMDAKEAAHCAKIIGAKQNVPVHMKPGELFSQQMAESFEVDNRLIVEPGQTICW